jgi:hypothetical protein
MSTAMCRKSCIRCAGSISVRAGCDGHKGAVCSNCYKRSDTARAPDAIAILVRALDSGDEWVRRGAVQALGSFGEDAAAAIPKLRTLEQDPAKVVRAAARAAVAALEAGSVESPTVRSR